MEKQRSFLVRHHRRALRAAAGMSATWRRRGQITAAAAVASAALLLSGCSGGADNGALPAGPPDPGSASSTAAAQPACPQLTAAVPPDLTEREEREPDPDWSDPQSVATIWSSPDGERVVNLSSLGADFKGSHDMGGTRKRITIGGVVALHEQNMDIDRVTWQPPSATAPCVHWAVVAQGLTPAELSAVLASVKEG